MSSLYLTKIVKKNKAAADDLEQKVAKELYNLQESKGNISADVSKIFITAAKEVKVEDSKPAIVLFVPFVKQKATQRIQSQLVRELEKKFNGQHVVVIADRTILSKSFARSKKSASGPRPRSRTLMHVQEKMMDDLVYPTEIVGKRMSYRQDGTKTMKVFLDPSKQMDIETKLDTFAAVYEFLTNKKVEFLFPQKN